MQHSGTPLAPKQGMPDDKDEVRGFDKEVEEEDAADLPQREAMSLLLDPTALVGGGLVPSSPTAPGSTPTPTEPGSTLTPAPPTAPTPGSDVATPAGPVSVPHLPSPPPNPGGTYNPDATSTSHT
jgi:hypothetical protein